MGLIFVDCEAEGPSPSTGILTEFGAVSYETGAWFHGKNDTDKTFRAFATWIEQNKGEGRPVFVSDNPAFDWQWINDAFHTMLGYNPFGHSARRIGDYYAGLVGDWRAASKWKKLRVTPHDHNPVHDAQGNVEAFRRIQAGER